LEARFGDEARAEINEAWLGFQASEAFGFKLELFLIPFGRYNQSNRPHQTYLVNFPLHLERMYPRSWRDLGVIVEGKWGVLRYSGYIGNGLGEGEDLSQGQQFSDNNSDKGRGLRLGLLLSGQLEVGWSYFQGKYDALNERILSLLGFYLAWETDSLHLLAEYAKASPENPAPFSEGRAEGFFVELALNFLGSAKPLVCYQRFDYKDSYHGLGFSDPLTAVRGIYEEKERWALGIVYAPSPNIYLKCEYDINKEKGLFLRNNVLAVELAVHF
jgi:hypothetical protein